MRQQTTTVKGFEHPQGNPLACRIGPIIATAVMLGRDPITKKMPNDVGEQARNSFEHLKRVLTAAKADLGDVVKLTIYVTDFAHRETVFKYWNEYFPDPQKRPVRHTMIQPMHDGMLVQVEAIAVAKDA